MNGEIVVGGDDYYETNFLVAMDNSDNIIVET